MLIIDIYTKAMSSVGKTLLGQKVYLDDNGNPIK
jgi:hypothetical protein